jgi:hypothetical protein
MPLLKTTRQAPAFYIGMLFMLLFACNRPSEKNYIEFQLEKTIDFTEYRISDIIGMPVDMVVQDDKVIVLDHKSDWFFHVFSVNGFDYLGNMFRRGMGTGEEIFLGMYLRAYGNDAILYQSHNAVKIATMGFRNERIEGVVVEEYKLPELLSGDNDFFKIKDNIFSSNGACPAAKDFRGYATQTHDIFERGAYLPMTGNRSADPGILQRVSQKLTTVKPTGGLVASVFHRLPILRIYSPGIKKLIVEQYTADASMNEKIMLNDPDMLRGGELISYYYRIKSTDEYIYALYSGANVSEHYQEGALPGVVDFSDEIHIWKWDGTPVMKLNLNRPVFSFDVTPDNKKIIASSIVDVNMLFAAEIPWD